MTAVDEHITRVQPAPLSAAQQRVITAAQELFAKHGIRGTSLQMIADTLGVTKAAVYHQFKTKDEIVIAATSAELAKLERAVEAAEQEPTRERAVDLLLTQIVDNVVRGRRRISLLQSDPAMARVLAEHQPFREFMDRLWALLIGEEASDRVQAAMIATALGAAAVHPLVVDLDDETLRTELLRFARRMVAAGPSTRS